MGGDLIRNYNYPLSSAILRKIARVNEDLAAELHKSSPFKPLVFSRLIFNKVEGVTSQGFLVTGNFANLYISTPKKEVEGAIVEGLLEDPWIEIKGCRLKVVDITKVRFRGAKRWLTLSPVVVATKREGKKWFLSPSEPEFYQELIQNALDKYRFFLGREYRERISLEEIGGVRGTRVLIKNTMVFAYDLSFSLRAEEEMVKLLWDVGLGEKNALGFGMMGYEDGIPHGER